MRIDRSRPITIGRTFPFNKQPELPRVNLFVVARGVDDVAATLVDMAEAAETVTSFVYTAPVVRAAAVGVVGGFAVDSSPHLVGSP